VRRRDEAADPGRRRPHRRREVQDLWLRLGHLATEWIKGKTLDEALAIQNTQIVEELSLPPVKIHCSVLAEDAIKAAVHDYKSKQAGEAKP
jgi:NifU-like protein involved in Fe-S cluster formation